MGSEKANDLVFHIPVLSHLQSGGKSGSLNLSQISAKFQAAPYENWVVDLLQDLSTTLS